MANANLSLVTVTNTFDQWRVTTNDLATDRNTLRNSSYVKDNGSFLLSNGAVILANGNLTLGNGRINVNNTITGNGYFGRDLFVANTVWANNLNVSAQTTLNNVYITGVIGGPGFQAGPGGGGAQGPQGSQGYQGVQGSQGFQGVPGGGGPGGSIIVYEEGGTLTTGVTSFDFVGAGVTASAVGNAVTVSVPGGGGPQGFQGVQGSQGFQGLAGGGPQGFQGVQGAQGFQGVQGAQGFQGVQGVQGAQGIQGAQGFQGAQGVQGSAGAATQVANATDGYVQLGADPISGVSTIIQWGRIDRGFANWSEGQLPTGTFPITFPNQCMSVSLVYDGYFAGNDYWPQVYTYGGLSQSNFTWFSQRSSSGATPPDYLWYIAVGY